MKLHSTKTLIQAQRRLLSSEDNVEFNRAKEIASLLVRGLRGFKSKEGTTSGGGWWVSLTRSGTTDEVSITSSREGDVRVVISLESIDVEKSGTSTRQAWERASASFAVAAAEESVLLNRKSKELKDASNRVVHNQKIIIGV